MDHYFLNELSFNLINLDYILITDQRLVAMEIISYSSSSCCYPVNQGRNLGGKSSDSKVSNFRNPRLLSRAKLIYKSGNLGLYKPDRLFLRNFRSLNSKVLAGNYEGYVIGAEDEALHRRGTIFILKGSVFKLGFSSQFPHMFPQYLGNQKH